MPRDATSPWAVPRSGETTNINTRRSRRSPMNSPRRTNRWKSADRRHQDFVTFARPWWRPSGDLWYDNFDRSPTAPAPQFNQATGTTESLRCLAVADNVSDRVHLDGLFRQIVEAAPYAMIMINADGRIAMVNAQVEIVFGYQRNEILGQPIEVLVPRRLRGHLAKLREAFSAEPRSGPMAPGRDLSALRKDGSEFPVEISLNPIQTDDGPMVLSAIVDISHRKEEEERIRAALREKEILLGEIHHRVKNNLQIVHSLLFLQSARISDPLALDLLRDSRDRLHSMALIHQTLYGSKDFARVDFAVFIDTLLPALIESHGVDTRRIAIRVDVEPVRLPIDIAIPCGLMVNELITNAFKHAFRDRDHGEIRVALTLQSGNEALLTVSDDGVGLPDHVDVERTDTLGLQLVGLLGEQIDGVMSIRRSDPTQFSVRFPI